MDSLLPESVRIGLMFGQTDHIAVSRAFASAAMEAETSVDDDSGIGSTYAAFADYIIRTDGQPDRMINTIDVIRETLDDLDSIYAALVSGVDPEDETATVDAASFFAEYVEIADQAAEAGDMSVFKQLDFVTFFVTESLGYEYE